jgi:primosomal protein N' (replication factor Y)
VVRVLPDVAAIDKEFDYWVGPELAGAVGVGSVVRVDLHGRRVGGWVTAMGRQPPAGVALVPVARVTGWGPDPDLVALATWAAWRWAGRRAHFLRAASPDRPVPRLPPAPRPGPPPPHPPGEVAALAAAALAGAARGGRPCLLRLPPGLDATAAVVVAAGLGPTLVVVPAARRAAVLAERLAGRGLSVAVLPDQWDRARAGVQVVIGARGAAWAPCPGLAATVVVDGHEESLTSEAAPTWNALEVVAERARRAGIPCLVTSPCPPPELVADREVIRPGRGAERRGWPAVEVVDRRSDDPRLGLWSAPVARLVRHGRVACVLNRRGRARLLACGVCGEVAACERCTAAVAEGDDGLLVCPRCGLARPPLCAACGSLQLKRLRIGVARARDELEALAGRPALEVSGRGGPPPEGDLVIGTEAVLSRSGPLDAVAFLDFDQELRAPRVGAAADAFSLLARAARLVGGRARAGRVVVQTRSPDHPVVRAAALADPDVWLPGEVELRVALRLPPAVAVAVVSGEAAPGYAADLGHVPGVDVTGPGEGGRWLVRAATATQLCDALAGAGRPPGRLRVEVDPRRL